MTTVFSPRSNTALRASLGAIALGGVATVAVLMIYVRTPWRRNQLEPVDQPVQFDHRHHHQDDGIECLFCHNTADRAATAGMPATDKCMGCHGQIWRRSALLEPVRRSYFSGMPIPWNRVHDVPDFVYFNHAIHVSKGIGCATCHGRVDRMARVYQVEPLTMQWCLDCHRSPERHVRPLDKVTDMAYDVEAQPPGLRSRLARELGLRRLTHCTTCHR